MHEMSIAADAAVVKCYARNQRLKCKRARRMAGALREARWLDQGVAATGVQFGSAAGSQEE